MICNALCLTLSQHKATGLKFYCICFTSIPTYKQVLKSNLFMPVGAFWYFRSRNKNDAIFKLYIRDVTLLGIVSVQHVQRISNYWMRGYSII